MEAFFETAKPHVRKRDSYSEKKQKNHEIEKSCGAERLAGLGSKKTGKCGAERLPVQLVKKPPNQHVGKKTNQHVVIGEANRREWVCRVGTRSACCVGGASTQGATRCNMYSRCTDPAVSANCNWLTRAIVTVTPYQLQLDGKAFCTTNVHTLEVRNVRLH
jgi:hypothetical protein